MILHCNLDKTDYRAFRRHVLFRYRKIHWIYGGIPALMLLLVCFVGQPGETLIDKVYFMIGGMIIFGGTGLAFFLVFRLIGRVTGAHFQGTVGEHMFEISQDGLTETNANGKIETRLSGIRRIDETAQHFFVITTAGLGHVIPKRGQENLEALRALQSRIIKA